MIRFSNSTDPSARGFSIHIRRNEKYASHFAPFSFEDCIKRAKKLILDLIFPRCACCMGCGSMLGCERDDLCEDCRAILAKRRIGVRELRGRSNLDGAAFAYDYRGPAGGMVRRLKYGSVYLLADEMGKAAAWAAGTLRVRDVAMVTAVPMHPRRLRQRGRNHSELIARSAAQCLNLPYEELLRRTRNAPQQARLSHAERRRNLKGAFEVPPQCRELVCGKRILLIDDVWTTGSTAESCAEALRAAGAERVYFAGYTYSKYSLSKKY